MNLLASEGHKDHQLLKKLVYVVPRGKVGPITKVYSKGYVELLIPQTNESHSNIFTLAEVVDTYVRAYSTIISLEYLIVLQRDVHLLRWH